MKDKELQKTIKDLVRGSGRSYPPSDESEVQVNRENCGAPIMQQINAGQETISSATLLNESPKKEAVAVM